MRYFHFNFLFSLLIIFIASFTLADWLPNVSLVTADCKSAVVEAYCPKLSVTRSIEFSLYYINGENQIGFSNFVRKCKNTESAKATFTLECKRLYAVNISLNPIFPLSKCTEYCENVVHTSKLWLLGNDCNNETKNDCIYDKYKIDLNHCPSSSTKCSNLSKAQPQQNVKSKYSEWQPKIKLVNAFCSNLTVEATCPNLNETRNLEFNLYNKGKNEILSTFVKICKPNKSKSWEVHFQIDCFNLYFIKVSLGITLNPPNCDEFCSNPHSSEIWLLGNSSCMNDNIDKCESIKYTTDLNKCPITYDGCVKSNSSEILLLGNSSRMNDNITKCESIKYTTDLNKCPITYDGSVKSNNYLILIICLSIISLIIIFIIIIYKKTVIKNYCFVKIWYHRAYDNVLLTTGSEV